MATFNPVMSLEQLLERERVGVLLRRFALGRVLARLNRQLREHLGLSHRQPLLDDAVGKSQRVRRSHQRARVTGRERAGHQHVADWLGQLQQVCSVLATWLRLLPMTWPRSACV